MRLGNQFDRVSVEEGMTIHRRHASNVVALIAAVLLAACTSAESGEPRADRQDPPASSSATSSTPAPATSSNPSAKPRGSRGGIHAPPPVTIRYFDESIELHAWTYCYRNGCVDAAPPDNPYDMGSPEEIGVEFAPPGWSFKALFTPAGEKCGRIQTVPLQPVGDGEFVLRPAGFAGTYDVTLFGRGGGGDLFVTFRWTTPNDGPLPEPRARLAVLAGGDGEVDSYGVELEVAHLAQTPRKATATVQVEAEGGRSLTFTAKRSHLGCFPEGTVYWDGPDDKGLAAAELGEGPFTYEVKLTLDGERYFATATWPKDEIRGNAPSVRLEFSPALPGL